jgi:hypothetical protein
MFTSNQDDPNKKTVIVKPFVFVVFLNMAAGHIHPLLPLLVSLPEHLSNVRRHAISRRL